MSLTLPIFSLPAASSLTALPPNHSLSAVFVPPTLHPTGLYRLPETPQNAIARSHILARTRLDPIRPAKAILQGGRRTKGRFETSEFILALERVYLPEYGCWLEVGHWIHKYLLLLGHDFAELVAFINKISYDSAFSALANHFGYRSIGEIREQYRGTSRYAQERSPLTHHVAWNFPEYYTRHHHKFYWYRSATGFAIAVMMELPTLSGDKVYLYTSLLHEINDQHVEGQEVFPEKPYHKFNDHLISWCPQADVVFVETEPLAEYYGDTYTNPKSVFTTVPGGTRNIIDADLNGLEGRRVRVVLPKENLFIAKLIEARFRDAGAADLAFSLGDPSGKAMQLGALERVALEYGITMTEPAADVALSDSVTPSILAPTDFNTFLDAPIPPRSFVLAPIIPEQGLVMIHAARGIGKTHCGLGIAFAVATGGEYLGWRAPGSRRVLYLDGEMPAATMQQRLKHIRASSPSRPDDGFFEILNSDLLGRSMPDISTVEGQGALEAMIKGVDLIVLDNLSTLCRSGNENGSDSWALVQAWLLELRRRGKAVLIIHHSGKNGTQRGASRHEDILDTVIKLCWPHDYAAVQGARFEVHLEKARSIFGDDAEPFEAWLTVQDGKATWKTRRLADLVDPAMEQAKQLLISGASVRDVEEVVGMSKSAAGRLRKQLVSDGCLSEKDPICPTVPSS